MTEVASESPLLDARARANEATAHYAPSEPRAMGVMAILAAAVILWILLPVGVGALVGALLAFTLHRTYDSLARKTRHPFLVALGLTIAASLVVAGTFGVLAYLLILQGFSVVSGLPKDLAPGGRADLFIRQLVAPLAPLNVHADNVMARLRDALDNLATSLANWAAQMVWFAFDSLLGLFFMAITMHFVLRYWQPLARRAEH
jgi:predicted PurR-regulated permease PerM